MKTTHRIYISLPIVLVLLLISITSFSQEANKEDNYASVEERRLQEQLRAKEQSSNSSVDSLISRQNDLKILEESVDMKLAEVETKIAELKKIRSAIEALLADKDAEETKRLNGLAKIYEKMSADKAALAIIGLDRQLASDLLSAMKAKSAAKVLNNLPRSITSELTTKFSATQLE